MKSQQLKILLGIGITWVITVAGNGCGASFGTKNLEDVLVNGSTALSTEQRTSYGVRTISMALQNMLSVTQYNASVEDIELRYDQHKNALSVTGAPDSLNAPMMLALTNIAMEVCDQLVDRQESQISDPSQRRYFTNVNFGQGVGQGADVRPWISQMARDFWGREASVIEADMIASSANNAFSNAGDANQMGLKTKYVCAGMLGSLESNMQR